MISDRPESRHDLLHSTSAGIQKDRASGRSANVSEPQPSDEILRRIAQRAFQLYEQRGREDGHDVERRSPLPSTRTSGGYSEECISLGSLRNLSQARLTSAVGGH
jgi:hypothetical protein